MDNLESAGDMVEPEPRSRPRYIPEIIVGAGYLLFFGLLIVLCGAALTLAYGQQSSSTAVSPTRSAVSTSTPHVRATPGSSDPSAFVENFSSNANQWAAGYSDWRGVAVGDGKLTLSAPGDNSYLWATCGPCFLPRKPYYVQADFTTSAVSDRPFGLLVRLRYAAGDFYLFGINTEAHQYLLYHHISDIWSLRVAALTDSIRSFPATNTLGIYVANGRLEFYINGDFIDSFSDIGTNFEEGMVGVYAEGAGYQLQVDNLIAKPTGGE